MQCISRTAKCSFPDRDGHVVMASHLNNWFTSDMHVRVYRAGRVNREEGLSFLGWWRGRFRGYVSTVIRPGSCDPVLSHHHL
jgi:hypothetical protein